MTANRELAAAGGVIEPIAEAPARQRAAVFIGDGRVELREAATPRPGAGEVRVRIEGCGVCGSNLPVFEGREWFQYPTEPGAPGHEGWGRIERLGDGVTGLEIGQRVALLSYHAYAEYDVAPAGQIVALPDALPGGAFPAEPLACAVNAFRRCRIEPGQRVGIVGIGFLGALMTQLAAGAGARVIAISRRASALEIARRCGAEATLALGPSAEIVQAVAEWTGGAMLDCAIEATGAAGPLDLAGELAGTRGRLVIAGFHQDGPRTVNMQGWNWRGLDVINAHEREPRVYVEGMHEAVRLVETGRLDPEPLLTHRVPLERIGEAFALMQRRPEGFLKAVVTP